MIAHASRIDPATARRFDLAHGARAVVGDRREVADGLNSRSRVLLLDPTDARSARLWTGGANFVVAVASSPELAEALAADCDRVVMADLNQPHPLRELGREAFDLVLILDRLGRVANPDWLLRAARACLIPGGELVVSAPNAVHRKARLAVMAGRDPYEAIDPGNLRLFTRVSLVEAVERAGFAVCRVRPEPPAVPAQNGDESEDEDSLALGWVLSALALPVDGMDWVQSRFREAAVARLTAERESELLGKLGTDIRAALDASHRRADRLRAALMDAHECLDHRDREHRETVGDLLDRGEAIESELHRREEAARIEAIHTEGVRAALHQWHERSEAEFEESKLALVASRDTAHQHALAAEARCHALENRIEHVLMEFPRRVARRVRRLFVRGR